MYDLLVILSEDSEIREFCSLSLAGIFSGVVFELPLGNPSAILIDFIRICANGFDELRSLAMKYAPIPVYVISREHLPCFAVKAVQAGACDFIEFPCTRKKLSRKILHFLCKPSGGDSGQSAEICGFEEFAGSSAQILELKKQLAFAAANDFPLLLLGETGTGKTLAADLVHKASRRAKNSFFALNISGMNESLVSSELFGSVKGAYTGSVNHRGFFEMADSGTLFLDEIGDLTLSMQIKLLHVVDSGLFYRLGSTTPQKTTTRIIAATNADLSACIKNKTFRTDLYYRLSIFPLCIPPLRERRQDIELIADIFATRNGKRISADGLQKLREYDWPGNVRELYNCVYRSCLLCSGEVIEAPHIVFLSAFM